MEMGTLTTIITLQKAELGKFGGHHTCFRERFVTFSPWQDWQEWLLRAFHIILPQRAGRKPKNRNKIGIVTPDLADEIVIVEGKW